MADNDLWTQSSHIHTHSRTHSLARSLICCDAARCKKSRGNEHKSLGFAS